MQRRHQKVIEEAPAPGIPRKLIEKIGERCAAACRKIGYRGAGTFEFLYENGEFYFIEMNTRVQVEHPVTEMITGIDIVQDADHASRPARSCRSRSATSRCAATRSNAASTRRTRTSSCRRRGASRRGTRRAGPGMRVDSHAYTNYFVPPNYDSMIGKIIVHGDTREQALARMRIALLEMVVEGIQTNIPLHRELMIDAKFIDGGTSIHYLEEWRRSTSADLACDVRAAAVRRETRVETVSEALDALDALSVSVEDADARHRGRAGAVRRTGHAAAQGGLAALARDGAVRRPRRGARSARRCCWRRTSSAACTLLGDAEVPEQDWVRLTQSQFAPVEITPEFWIVPTWHEPPAQARR